MDLNCRIAECHLLSQDDMQSINFTCARLIAHRTSQQNETCTALDVKSKSLGTSAEPSSGSNGDLRVDRTL